MLPTIKAYNDRMTQTANTNTASARWDSVELQAGISSRSSKSVIVLLRLIRERPDLAGAFQKS